jgi:hypothetical protein
VRQADAHTYNWTLGWIDQNEQLHEINLIERSPASVPEGGKLVAPYGTFERWTNTFRACAPAAHPRDVKGIVLTPKELPYAERELVLNWN